MTNSYWNDQNREILRQAVQSLFDDPQYKSKQELYDMFVISNYGNFFPIDEKNRKKRSYPTIADIGYFLNKTKKRTLRYVLCDALLVAANAALTNPEQKQKKKLNKNLQKLTSHYKTLKQQIDQYSRIPSYTTTKPTNTFDNLLSIPGLRFKKQGDILYQKSQSDKLDRLFFNKNKMESYCCYRYAARTGHIIKTIIKVYKPYKNMPCYSFTNSYKTDSGLIRTFGLIFYLQYGVTFIGVSEDGDHFNFLTLKSIADEQTDFKGLNFSISPRGKIIAGKIIMRSTKQCPNLNITKNNGGLEPGLYPFEDIKDEVSDKIRCIRNEITSNLEQPILIGARRITDLQEIAYIVKDLILDKFPEGFKYEDGTPYNHGDIRDNNFSSSLFI